MFFYKELFLTKLSQPCLHGNNFFEETETQAVTVFTKITVLGKSSQIVCSAECLITVQEIYTINRTGEKLSSLLEDDFGFVL